MPNLRSKLCNAILGLAAGCLLATRVHADVITIDTSDGAGQVGAYYGPYTDSDDPPAGYPAIPDPDIEPTFQNYFMGRTTVSGFTTSERRPFFLFDTTGIAASIPAGHVITDVFISLELLPGGTSALANFAVGDLEMVDFSSTPFSADAITSPGMIPHDTIWETFGSSKPYGGFELLGTTHPSPTIPDTYEIPLPGAIADLESSIAAEEVFAITARLATFDPGPIGKGTDPVDPYEYVFGGTDIETPSGSSTTAAPTLTIFTTAVPEPSSSLVLAGFLIRVLLRRNRRPR